MNSLAISTDPNLLSAELSSTTLNLSPSVSTFLPEEDASICPLLPGNSPSPPLNFVHPLTPSPGNDADRDDGAAETASSSGSSSGLGMIAPINGAANIFTNHNYQHFGKTNEIKNQESNGKQNCNLPLDKEVPSFVHWNWPVIRKCTFFVFLSGIFAMCAIVVSMIIQLPRKCNPEVPWYKGSVFYEIFPASFQDSDGDGLGDFKGLASRADYLQNLGIGVVRLNSIFPSNNYPDHFQDVTSLVEIDEVLGKYSDFVTLLAIFHSRNISVVLDFPIYPFLSKLETTFMNATEINQTNSIGSEFAKLLKTENIVVDDDEENLISLAMRKWLRAGVDGFYVKGMENFFNDPNLLDNLREWKYLLGEERILIVSKKLIDKVHPEIGEEILKTVDLVDIFLNVANGTQPLSNQIKGILQSNIAPGYGPWIHWSLGGVTERRLANGVSANASLAAILMQLMLPGSPSIFYGDEIYLTEINDPLGDHKNSKHLHHLLSMSWNTTNQFTSRGTLPWLPSSASASFHHLDYVIDLINLRKTSPSIYQNVVIKDTLPIQNTNIRSSHDDLLIIERRYPRRSSFASITNLSSKKLSLDLTSMFYSGQLVIGPSKNSKVYFANFDIQSLETVIVRLDK